MIFSRLVSLALLGLPTAADIQKSSNLRRVQGGGNGNGNGNGNEKKMEAPCTLILRVGESDNQNQDDIYEWDCELDPLDGNGIVSFPDKKFKKDEFESGSSTLFGDVTVDKANGKAKINGDPIIGRRGNKNKDRRSLNGRNLAPLGDRSVLAIRVVGNDITTTASETKIAEEIFGINDSDVFNLSTGFAKCSYDALSFSPTPDEPDRSITNGVYTVVLNEDISALTNFELQTKVVNQASAELGTLNEQFDHVMLCLPPIAGFNGIAYAYVNWYLSVYKDAWCNYPSAQLHEIGHNIGLAHSNEGTQTYADQSGMMGYSYSQDEGPRMCFNNAKNWQLGWYADRRATATPLESPWNGNLVGFAEYGIIPETSDDVVLLRVEGDDVDYYVGFNRKIGINSGTVEGGNQVTIQSRALGETTYAPSVLVAKLSAGGIYEISDFGAGATVFIEVTSIDVTSSPGVASVRVYKELRPTQAPTKNPTNRPTQSPTPAPTRPVTEYPTRTPVTSPPTATPTDSPTAAPTKAPVSPPPTASPTGSPTEAPKCYSNDNPIECRADSACFWRGGSCREKSSCASYGGKQTCRSNKCVWNNSGNTCVAPQH